MWTFYVKNAYVSREVKVYSIVTFPSREIAEKRAREVSMLMGNLYWGVEEVKVGE